MTEKSSAIRPYREGEPRLEAPQETVARSSLPSRPLNSPFGGSRGLPVVNRYPFHERGVTLPPLRLGRPTKGGTANLSSLGPGIFLFIAGSQGVSRTMREKLEKLKQAAEEQIDAASSPEQLKEIRVKYLGKKGEITSILRRMKDLSPEERPVIGSLANQVRGQLEEWIQEKEESLQEALLEARLQEESIDVTLPGRPEPLGTVHPLNGVIEQIEDIFIGMGFEVAEGPEVETDYYNFEALNLPKDHPARDMQDSFYITPELLLRTQTSPVQVRSMESKEGKVPVKIICPGKVYRRDDDDATHTHQFTQVEGLVVDRGIAMSELHGTLL